jgi:hypothetical protein
MEKVCPWQNEVPAKTGADIVSALIVRFIPLLLPVVAGFELTTRILYAVPVAVVKGIVALMVPALVEVSVPMATGLAKLPVASESCAVNMFPAVKVPLMVYGTFTAAPAQKGEPVIVVEVVMDCEKTLHERNKSPIRIIDLFKNSLGFI